METRSQKTQREREKKMEILLSNNLQVYNCTVNVIRACVVVVVVV